MRAADLTWMPISFDPAEWTHGGINQWEELSKNATLQQAVGESNAYPEGAFAAVLGLPLPGMTATTWPLATNPARTPSPSGRS